MLFAAGATPLGASASAPTQVELRYAREVGTETCPDEAALRAAVIARLGRDPFLKGARAAVSVRMTALGGLIRALIRTENLGEQSTGEREVSGDVRECVELVSSSALAIAIAIDPQVLTRPAPSATPADLASPPTAAPQPPRPATAKLVQTERAGAAATPRSSAWYELTLGAQATWRELPGVGFLADMRRSTRGFSVALEGGAGLEKARELDGGKLDVASLQSGLVLCWRLQWLGLCGKGGLVAQRLAASGYPDAREGWLFDARFGPRLEASGLLTPSWGLRSHLDAAISARSVDLKRSGEVIGQLPRLGVAAGIGVFFRLP